MTIDHEDRDHTTLFAVYELNLALGTLGKFNKL